MNDIDPTGAVADWWATGISRIEPDVIELRGHPIQELIGTVNFPSMIWLMVRGDLPSPAQSTLLEAALVAAVDHGPQAPSIAVARIAATCGIDLNNAVASAVNTLGDVHGGAGEQCVELLDDILEREGSGLSLPDAVDAAIAAGPSYLPGFGHRFHERDPRRDPLISLVERAVREGTVPGRHLRAALALEAALAGYRTKPVPMNVDGATAVVYAELGFAAPLARGLFVLSRSVGILAHTWEEVQGGQRNKGPLPREILPTFLNRVV
ncbi:citryl-CoA lyase [Glycomyces harbinensis]|uniref:citrate synthase (unknown stereospecificity) n=1 Tax=Glycomyces harbinensis TaxID=58114 RepID=A0A1G6XK85_9ACTN|nr:citryl-CoA lyase [Glycomyces harbinensis]SDD78628.1 citrate synthase [Glycomyces harbinensis]